VAIAGDRFETVAEPERILSRAPGEQQGRFPDFIIAGAMKSGTTSLHQILASDPNIYIPAEEIFFFDMDDLFQHPDFFYPTADRWLTQPYRPDLPRTRAWYSSFFAPAQEGQLVGEDSTTYLASEKAAERIAAFSREIKVIVLLRDPAARTYSHYWHLVRTGRATLGFEDALRFAPGTLIQRSLYKPQVERFLNALGRQRLMILLFEEFVTGAEAQVRLVYDFLGMPLPAELTADKHANAALVPRWPRMQLWWNSVQRRAGGGNRYLRHVMEAPEPTRTSRAARFLDRAFRTVNPTMPRRPPLMDSRTHRMLNDYFSVQNEGLDELAGKDLRRFWYRD
jgi:sulfotransferase family protein